MVEYDKMTKGLFMSMDLDSLSKSELEKVIIDALAVVGSEGFYLSDGELSEYEDKVLMNKINYLIGIEEEKNIPKPISFKDKLLKHRNMVEYIYRRNEIKTPTGYKFTNEEDFPF